MHAPAVEEDGRTRGPGKRPMSRHVLQMAHLFRHRPLGQMQFLGSAGKTQVARGAFESNQGIGRRQKGAFHVVRIFKGGSSFQFGMNNGGEIAFPQLPHGADCAEFDETPRDRGRYTDNHKPGKPGELDTAQEKPQIGEIVAAGPGKTNESGKVCILASSLTVNALFCE